MKTIALVVATVLRGLTVLAAEPTTPRSLTLPECLGLALQQNPAVLKAQQELRRTHGVIVEARAPALPQVNLAGQFTQIDKGSLESFPRVPLYANQEQPWSVQVQVTQLLYSGGKVGAALRAAKLTDQIAIFGFHRTVNDTVLAVRQVFYQVLLTKAVINVRTQAVVLLEQQLTDARHRFDAGAVPRFNVLRAEVELANAKPPLIRAQNDLRLAREALVKLLAIDSVSPRTEFTTINFTGELQYIHRPWALADALRQALAHRPELQQAEKQIAIAAETVDINKAGYQPTVNAFGTYGLRDRNFSQELDRNLYGWTVGVQANWPIFDGLQTAGRVEQARAVRAQTELDAADTRRSIELEVRQAYSTYLQTLELLEAQKKTVEQAAESLRLAEARFRAGTGTQLDVLSAQTALTQARSDEVQALYDYNVALATLDRVTGATVKQ
jgi:TolC family type I secretion outer membrane protein